MEKEGFGEADTSSGVEERGDLIVFGVVKHHFMKEVALAVPASAAIPGVLVVVEGIICGLAEVATSENKFAEAEVERVKEIIPVSAAQDFRPCRLTCSVHGEVASQVSGLGAVKKMALRWDSWS